MTEGMIPVHRSDLEKILDTLDRAESFHRHRDEMNAAVHLAETRYSPLTGELSAQVDRVGSLLQSQPIAAGPQTVAGQAEATIEQGLRPPIPDATEEALDGRHRAVLEAMARRMTNGQINDTGGISADAGLDENVTVKVLQSLEPGRFVVRDGSDRGEWYLGAPARKVLPSELAARLGR